MSRGRSARFPTGATEKACAAPKFKQDPVGNAGGDGTGGERNKAAAGGKTVPMYTQMFDQMGRKMTL